MSLDDDVTVWIDGLRNQDSVASRKLWERYYRQLVELAAKRLPNHIRRDFDEEDVALSAINSLCRGAAAGRFPDLSDRDSLWALLIVITSRKCRAQVRKHLAQKRGGGTARGESAFRLSLGAGIADEMGNEPTPEFAAMMVDEVRSLLDQLPDDNSRRLAILKMEGNTNAEAATRLQCSQTTIERRLRMIRKMWSQ